MTFHDKLYEAQPSEKQLVTLGSKTLFKFIILIGYIPDKKTNLFTSNKTEYTQSELLFQCEHRGRTLSFRRV
jgi:hypothetical protein